MTEPLQITHGMIDNLVDVSGGTAYRLNGLHANEGGNYLSFNRDTSYFGQEQLSIGIAFQVDTQGDGGNLFRIHKALQISITDDGQAVFNLIENSLGEKGVIQSTGLDLTDGNWHQISLTYDAVAGTMTGYVDGAAVGAVAISGPTKIAESWDPMIGDPWGDGLRGLVDDIRMSTSAWPAEGVASHHEALVQKISGSEPPPLVLLDFSEGKLMDRSGNGFEVTHGSPGSIVDGGYRLNGLNAKDGGNYIALERSKALFSQEQLSISLDIKADSPGLGGSVLRIHTAMQVDVTDDGDVIFKLIENSVGENGIIESQGLNVTDGAWHNLTLAYDAVGGVMKGYVDGVEVGYIPVSGATKGAESWDPMIGDPWGKGFSGLVDNIKIDTKMPAGFTVGNQIDQPSPDTAEPTVLFSLPFSGGLMTDISGNDIGITHGGSNSIEQGWYHLNGENAKNGGNYIAIERNDSLFSQDELSFSIDFKSDGTGAGGTLFRIHTAMQIDITDDGQVTFKLLENSVGESGVISSSDLNVLDGKWHHITLTYDANAGAMTGSVDGADVGQIAVSGATKAAEYWDPMIGDPWGKGVKGYIDNVEITGPAPTPETEPVSTDGPVIETPLDPAVLSQLLAVADAIHDNPIVVNNSAELVDALQNASGGETILLRPDVDYGGLVRNVFPDEGVVVTSLDPSDPASITGLDLRSVNNVTFDNVVFGQSGTVTTSPTWVNITDSDGIQFTNSVFKGTAEGIASDSTLAADNLMLVRNSENFTFDHNEVSGFMHGLSVLNSKDIIIDGNDMHHMQGDGMRFAQVQGINIENNKIHDFFGADQSVTHNDYIQFWTTQTTEPSTDIVIRGNSMLSGEFQSQAIFFRDQLGDLGLGEMRYQNVLIEENVIYNNNYHGITVPNADGVIIRGNSLIPHPDGDGVSSINVANSTGVQVYDNVTPRLSLAEDNDIYRQFGNVIVQNDYASQPDFVGDLFVNAGIGPEAEMSNLMVAPDSTLLKEDGTVYGSELLRLPGESDKLMAVVVAEADGTQVGPSLTFDAGHTVDSHGLVTEDDARFIWDFGDGHKAEGQKVTHAYDVADSYEVMLTVLENSGQSDSARFVAQFDTPTNNVLDFEDGSISFYIQNPDDIWNA